MHTRPRSLLKVNRTILNDGLTRDRQTDAQMDSPTRDAHKNSARPGAGNKYIVSQNVQSYVVQIRHLYSIMIYNDLIDKLRQSDLGSVYVLVHCLLVVFCTRTTLHCFLVVVMDSRNLLIYAMIMESNGILNLTPRKVRLQLLVVTPLLCPSNWATLP